MSFRTYDTSIEFIRQLPKPKRRRANFYAAGLAPVEFGSLTVTQLRT